MRNRQYVITPPSLPPFLFKYYPNAWEKVIQWSKDEFQARLVYLAEHGYWRELRMMNENYSPARILAELSGYRKMCAVMSETVWNKLNRKDRKIIRNALELRDMLLR